MASVLLEDIDVRVNAGTKETGEDLQASSAVDRDGIAVELGVWLSGLESFLSGGHRPFIEGSPGSAEREFRLVHSGLQRSSMLNAMLLGSEGPPVPGLRDLASILREALLISQRMIDSAVLGTPEWKAWADMLSYRLGNVPAFRSLIRNAEDQAGSYLPEAILASLALHQNAELAMILPRFARVLKWLSVIGGMLANDEPLKPALLIFARVNEQILELTTYINNRVDRAGDSEAELLASLDAAAYTASLELKKVYSQALAGIADVRPSPSVYARMETAQSLLSDGFQQIVAGFARLMDPGTDVFELFPNFRVKRDQSIVLCIELKQLIGSVQAAETDPEKKRIAALRTALRSFMQSTVKYLFYKDTETVERFVEEILVAKQNKDLVPILHRFGAYLETLRGQVIMRAVLEGEPRA